MACLYNHCNRRQHSKGLCGYHYYMTASLKGELVQKRDLDGNLQLKLFSSKPVIKRGSQ